jgi:hypothetical protein
MKLNISTHTGIFIGTFDMPYIPRAGEEILINSLTKPERYIVDFVRYDIDRQTILILVNKEIK